MLLLGVSSSCPFQHLNRAVKTEPQRSHNINRGMVICTSETHQTGGS